MADKPSVKDLFAKLAAQNRAASLAAEARNPHRPLAPVDYEAIDAAEHERRLREFEED